MTLKLVDALNSITMSPEAKELYRQSDIQSAALTKHGEPHALGVMDFGKSLADQIETYFPGTFTPDELEFTIPAGCYGHDIGRSHGLDIINGKSKDRHEYWGARIFKELLDKAEIPHEYQAPVLYSIINHRANGCLGRDALAPPAQPNPAHDVKRRTLAVVVLADKCVGDAERVRTGDAFFIKAIRVLRLSRWFFDKKANEDKKNDFANYAIKNAQLLVDPNDNGNDPRYRGAIILKLKLDERICTMEQIFSVKWFREAYHCCGKSAQVLGFEFRIQANDEVWFFSKQKDAWAKRSELRVPQNP
jgi:hypothetical protein